MYRKTCDGSGKQDRLHDSLVNVTPEAYGVAQDLILDVGWPQSRQAHLVFLNLALKGQADLWHSTLLLANR